MQTESVVEGNHIRRSKQETRTSWEGMKQSIWAIKRGGGEKAQRNGQIFLIQLLRTGPCVWKSRHQKKGTAVMSNFESELNT